MGDLTLLQLKSELRAMLGNRTDYDDNLTNWLNFTQDMMCRQFDFPELEQKITTSVFVDSAATYTFSSRARSIHSVRLLDGANSRKLSYIPVRNWDSVLPKPDYHAEGRPTMYTFYNNQLEYYQVPDDDYSGVIRCYVYPTELSADGDYSDFDSKDDILLAIAAAWAFKVIGNDERMTSWGNHGWNQIKQAVLSEDRKPDREIKPIRELRGIVGQPWLDPFNRG